MHWPTARALPPVTRASSPYVVTRPVGTLRTKAKTDCWKGVRVMAAELAAHEHRKEKMWALAVLPAPLTRARSAR